MRLYIHIPFCVKKCDYCDFLSYAGMGEKVSLYLTALKKDIIHTAEELSLRERERAGVSDTAAADGVNAHPKVSLDSVYIGGGTPGYLPADAIASVMDTVKEHFDIAPNAEITIETNPCTVTCEKASAYIKSGINRVSMGVQSFDDNVLKTLGRAHNSDTAVKAFHILRDAGFKNINLDLISCVPGDTKEGFIKSLNTAISLNPEHISAYELIIEEGTGFYKKYGPESDYKADEDLESEVYAETEKVLRAAGYLQYEISNFAKPGFESQHNLGYWKQEEYIGCGLGAVSGYSETFASTVRNGWVRKRKQVDIDKYISEPLVTENEVMDKSEAMREYAVLNLRTVGGLNTERYIDLFGCKCPENIINTLNKYSGNSDNKSYPEGKYIIKNNNSYHFTPEGFLISNTVLAEMID